MKDAFNVIVVLLLLAILGLQLYSSFFKKESYARFNPNRPSEPLYIYDPNGELYKYTLENGQTVRTRIQ